MYYLSILVAADNVFKSSNYINLSLKPNGSVGLSRNILCQPLVLSMRRIKYGHSNSDITLYLYMSKHLSIMIVIWKQLTAECGECVRNHFDMSDFKMVKCLTNQMKDTPIKKYPACIMVLLYLFAIKNLKFSLLTRHIVQ